MIKVVFVNDKILNLPNAVAVEPTENEYVIYNENICHELELVARVPLANVLYVSYKKAFASPSKKVIEIE